MTYTSVWRVPSPGDVALFSELAKDPDSPSLSDLIGLFLKENVKDPSIVSVEPASSRIAGHDDTDVAEVKLNNFIVAWVLNTEAIIRLRQWTPTTVTIEDRSPAPDFDVPAADPLLFEKLWEHIAFLDGRINCPGWSLIEKNNTIEVKRRDGMVFWGERKTTENAYPGFNDV